MAKVTYSQNSGKGLNSLRILVVEDQFLVAKDLAGFLRSRGAEIVGPAASAAEGRELAANHDLDMAILDVNLGGSTVFELARGLKATGTPVIFVSGYDKDCLPAELETAHYVRKPFRALELVSTIQGVIASERGAMP